MRLFLFIVAMIVLLIVMSIGAGVLILGMKGPDAPPNEMTMWVTLIATYAVYLGIFIFALRKYVLRRS